MVGNDGQERLVSSDCALIYADSEKGPFAIIGGGSGNLGWPSRHRMHFACLPNPQFQRPSVRIKISFPIAPDTAATHYNRNGRCHRIHYIEVILYAGTFTSRAEIVSEEMLARLPEREGIDDKPLTLMRFNLNENCTTSVGGLGVPFQARDAEDHEVLNCGKPLEGVRTITQILAQTEFFVLVHSGELLEKAQTGFKEEFGEEDEWFVGFPYSGG